MHVWLVTIKLGAPRELPLLTTFNFGLNSIRSTFMEAIGWVKVLKSLVHSIILRGRALFKGVKIGKDDFKAS